MRESHGGRAGPIGQSPSERRRGAERISGAPRRSATPNHDVIAPRYERRKRRLDVFLALCLLPVVLPVMALCGIAIWVSDGRPLLFRQERTGRGGRRFEIYKFRTMIVRAHELRGQYRHLNQLSGPDFKIDQDPRVTWVGRFLRQSSLDELPQIFNVLKGDMSFVGPRPTSFAASTYSLWHTERLEVIPGITGLWQVNGRGDVDFDERVRLDVEYIESRSLGTDLRILLKTPKALIDRRGAY